MDILWGVLRMQRMSMKHFSYWPDCHVNWPPLLSRRMADKSVSENEIQVILTFCMKVSFFSSYFVSILCFHMYSLKIVSLVTFLNWPKWGEEFPVLLSSSFFSSFFIPPQRICLVLTWPVWHTSCTSSHQTLSNLCTSEMFFNMFIFISLAFPAHPMRQMSDLLQYTRFGIITPFMIILLSFSFLHLCRQILEVLTAIKKEDPTELAEQLYSNTMKLFFPSEEE